MKSLEGGRKGRWQALKWFRLGEKLEILTIRGNSRRESENVSGEVSKSRTSALFARNAPIDKLAQQHVADNVSPKAVNSM